MPRESWSDLERQRDAAGDDGAWLGANERLLRHPALPHGRRRFAIDEGARRLPRLSDLLPATRLLPIDTPVAPGFVRSNPCIVNGPDGGLAMIVRGVDYVHDLLGYHASDPSGIIHTVNTFVELDADLRPTRVTPLVDATTGVRYPTRVAGWEDMRLFAWDGRWWALAASRELNAATDVDVALLAIEDDGRLRDGRRVVIADRQRAEKNWLPFVGAHGPMALYGASPTRVVALDLAQASAGTVVQHRAPAIASELRGGGGLLPLGDGWLAVAHEVALYEGRHRLYQHRFVRYDAGFHLVEISPPWRFIHHGIEFVAGVATVGDDLVLSFGFGDREAWLARLPVADVLALLAPAADLVADPVAEVPGAATSPALAQAPDAAAGITPAVGATDWTPVPGALELVSVTMTGNAADIIADAIASVVDWVDAVIVVDTGATDDTIAIARAAAGDKFILRHHAWTEDFAGARNAMLAIAATTGARWAVHVDSDERIDPGAVDVRAVLLETPHDVLMVGDRWGTYRKERVFRLPAAGAYTGRTHEAFVQWHGTREILHGVSFFEKPKDAEAFRRKCERDVRILLEVTAETPRDPRWHYYLGQSYEGLGRHHEAIAAFEACAALRGWDEEAGWAMYKAASCWLVLDDPGAAVDCCARGMALCPGMAELPWLAGFASWKMGRHQQAVHWARMAIVLGRVRGGGNDVPRYGFQEPRGQWEGPFDVLRFSLRALGDDAAADDAERLFTEALAARERGDARFSLRGRAVP